MKTRYLEAHEIPRKLHKPFKPRHSTYASGLNQSNLHAIDGIRMGDFQFLSWKPPMSLPTAPTMEDGRSFYLQQHANRSPQLL